MVSFPSPLNSLHSNQQTSRRIMRARLSSARYQLKMAYFNYSLFILLLSMATKLTLSVPVSTCNLPSGSLSCALPANTKLREKKRDMTNRGDANCAPKLLLPTYTLLYPHTFVRNKPIEIQTRLMSNLLTGCGASIRSAPAEAPGSAFVCLLPVSPEGCHTHGRHD